MTRETADGTTLKSAHLISPNDFGGAETVVRALAQGRSAYIDKTAVIAMLSDQGPNQFTESLVESGIQVLSLKRRGRRYSQEAKEVALVARQLGLDVLNTHTAYADFVGYLAARMAHLPVVATVHGFVGGDRRTRFYEWFDRLLLRRFDAVISVSEHNQERLLMAGCPRGRLHIVPNGVAPSKALPKREARDQLGLSSQERIIGWIGRLSAEKGPDLFLDALEHIGGSGIRAVVIGDGPLRVPLEQRAASSPCAVQFVGMLPDAARFVKAFDLLVLSSRTEGLPMVLLEALAAGVPVAAYAVGGVPEIVSTETGWLVEPFSPAGLGQAVLEALGDETARLKRAARGQALVDEHYGLESWVRRTEEVYSAAAVSHSRRAGANAASWSAQRGRPSGTR